MNKAFILAAALPVLAPLAAKAQVTVYTSETTWSSLFDNTSGITFTATNIELADEVAANSLGSSEVALGNTLTFSDTNTSLGLSFTLTADSDDHDFRYKDSFYTGNGAWTDYDLLSVGNRVYRTSDDFTITITDSLIYGFGLEIKNDTATSGESISLYNGSDLVQTIDISSLNPTNTNDFLFIGISSDTAFNTIVFDENHLDDLGISSVSFSTSAAAVPEPSTYALILGFLSVGLMIYRRRKS